MADSEKIRNPCPYDTINWIQKIFYTWMFPLFYRGYKRDLDADDFCKCPKEDDARTLVDKLDEKWQEQLSKPRPSLPKAILKSFWREYIPLLCISLFEECVLRIAQPLLVGFVIRYFTNRATADPFLAQMAAGCVCLMTVIMVTTHQPLILGTGRLGMRARVACSALIYRKILRLSKSALTHTAVGQIVNIMSNDVNRVDELVKFLAEFVTSPIQTIIVITILWHYLGVACIGGIIILALFIPFQMKMGRLFGQVRRKTAILTDQRIRVMSEIISGMRVIKMYAWEKAFADFVNGCRKKEVASIRRSCYLKAMNLSIFFVASRIIMFVCFITLVTLVCDLNAETVFVTMSLFNVIRYSMTSEFPKAIALLAETLVCCKRMQDFLILEEKAALKIEMQKTTLDSKPDVIASTSDASSFCTFAQKPEVIVKEMSAKWAIDAEESLKKISFSLKPGQLLAVIGQVGSGKSTLLMSLLRELPHTTGYMKVNGRVAYASQDAWSFNGSVRDNILFGQEYDARRFKKVVQASALERDLTLLEFGDQTLVGEKGVSLSGGQKARMTLARALYNEADIYLLDDPLSAVDSSVANHIFERCVMGFLKHKIRILVSHQLQFLAKADLILVLKEGEQVALHTYDELINSGLNFVSLLHKEEKEPKKAVEDSELKVPEKVTRMLYNRRSLSRMNSTNSDKADIAVDNTEIDVSDDGPKVSEEGKSTGSVKGDIYWKYVKAGAGIPLFTTMVVASIVSQALFQYSDVFLAKWTNREERASQTQKLRNDFIRTKTEELNSFNNTNTTAVYEGRVFDVETNYYIFVYSSITLCLFLSTLVRTISFFVMCMRASVNLHNTIFIKVLRAPISMFDNQPVGRILNRFARDLGIIDELLPATAFDLNLTMANAIGIIVVITTVNAYLLIPAIVITPIVIKVRGIYLKTARDIKRYEGMTRSPVFSHVSNTITGLPTIRAFDSQDDFEDKFYSYLNDHSATWFLYLNASRTLGLVMDWLCIIYICVVTTVIMAWPENMPGGNAGLVLTSSLVLTGMFQASIRQSAEFEAQMTAVERVLEYSDLESEGDLRSLKSPPKGWPAHGSIRFDHVSFTYAGSASPVLTDLTFEIKAGEKVGIVGRTGAGKSSLLQSLFRMVDPEGSIYIDDIDTKTLGLHDVRQKISIIPQDPVLFTGTVRYNLDPFGEQNDDTLWDVLREVNLKESVIDLPGELDGMVSEGGSNFSSGQRQLVCLARAILQNNQILVLDEATANVDHETDALVQETIRKKFSQCTVLTIAHRLNTIIDCDRVLVLDAGKLLEFDEPFELLKKPMGMFKSLVKKTGKLMSRQLFAAAEEHAKKRRSDTTVSYDDDKFSFLNNNIDELNVCNPKFFTFRL